MTQATEFFITHVLEPPQEYTDAEETGEIVRLLKTDRWAWSRVKTLGLT